MNSQLTLSTSFNSIIFITFFTISFFLLQISYSQDVVDQFLLCLSPFNCGALPNLSYPFWKDDRPYICRQDGFGLTKCDESGGFPVISISGHDFRLIHVNQFAYTMTIARNDLWENLCPANPINVTLQNPFLSYSQAIQNLSFFYNCDFNELRERVILPAQNTLGCSQNSFYANESLRRDNYETFYESCGTSIQVQVNQSAYGEFQHLQAPSHLQLGFDVQYNLRDVFCSKCISVGANCTSESLGGYPICEPGKDDRNLKLKLAIGFGGGIGGMLITCFLFYLLWPRIRGKVPNKSSYASGKSYSDRSSMLDTEKGDSFGGVLSFAARVHVFTYNELEEATNNFASDRELGDGGFGTVYYGKLRDGRAVAVKRLYENNYRRVEQFMNEVEILTRLLHKNLVQLYGCTSRHSRELLLVYEYVPKGTVADHLHGQHAKPGSLPWCIRLQIAIETADALRYLHASDTIHRDVKTNNILLDNNYTVKVADFGLSRLFPTDVTHVSTAPQGTPGYVDPEYHQCYQLTDKSDVFSFGVVLIELISSKPAVDITRHRHEINLSNMAINKIQNRALHELVDPSLRFQSDSKARKMITGVAEVAFQCLQNEKDLRPTMAEVLEALMGIQNEDYNKSNAEVMDISADEVVLLKSGPLPNSPDSVMVKWVSSGSTIHSMGS